MTIPYITSKQQEIPKLLYQFRFINRLQIQRLLNHKYHKRIQDWLNDLIEKEYVEKVPKANSFEERTKFTVYRIGINGIRFLKTQDDFFHEITKRLYRDKNSSDNFINQCTLLADIYLELHCQNTNQNRSFYEIATNSDFINPNSPFHFIFELNPHLVYEEKGNHKKKATGRYYLLEAFETTLPRHSIRKRIRTYLKFYYSNEWEDTINVPFPTIKFICPTKADLIYAKRYAKTLLQVTDQEIDLNIQFTTVDNVRRSGVKGKIWEGI